MQASEDRAPKYIKKIVKELKREKDSNIIITEDFKNPFSTMNRSCNQKINKEINLSNTIEQIDLKDIQNISYKRRRTHILPK